MILRIIIAHCEHWNSENLRKTRLSNDFNDYSADEASNHWANPPSQCSSPLFGSTTTDTAKLRIKAVSLTLQARAYILIPYIVHI